MKRERKERSASCTLEEVIISDLWDMGVRHLLQGPELHELPHAEEIVRFAESRLGERGIIVPRFRILSDTTGEC